MKKQVNKTLSLVIVLSLLVSMFSGLIVGAATITNPSFITFSPASLEEAIANDGSISNGVVTIELTGNNKFKSQTLFNSQVDFIVPSGYTVSKNWISATKFSISISGKAVDHAASTQNLQVIFNPVVIENGGWLGVWWRDDNDKNIVNIPINFYDNPSLTYNGNVFSEEVTNNGSFDVASPIIVSLTGEPSAEFKNITTFRENQEFTTANIPQGLNVSLIKVNSTQVKVLLNGNATAHNATDDISDAMVIFKDEAFLSRGSTVQDKSMTFSIRYWDSPSLSYVGSSFTESSANDGTIDANSKIVATIAGNIPVKFKTGTIPASAYTISPSALNGLSVVVNSIDGNSAVIKVNGTASAHLPSNSIVNATITFKKDAFTSPTNNIGKLTQTFSINFIDYNLSYTGNTFVEAAANDGTIDANSKVIASLNGTDAVNFKTGTLLNSAYSFNTALPAGLTATVASNGRDAVLTITGNVNPHLAEDSFTRAITFNSGAFLPANSNVNNLSQTFFVNFNDPGKVTADTTPFLESDNNDGSIVGQRALVLANASFIDVPFVANNHYTISGVPAGLTAKVTRDSANRLGLSLEGNATSHASNSAIVTLTLDNKVFIGNVPEITGQTQTFQLNFIDNAKIRVLEVYPSSITSTGDGNIQDAFNELTAPNLASKYAVTSMTMNRFISIIDDVNGNYDVVYFGRGRYMKGGPNDSYFGNDITSKAALKVLDFITSGQLCIFHDNAFKQDSATGTNSSMMATKFNVPAVTSKANVEIVTGTAFSLATTITNGRAASTTNKRPVMDIVENPHSYKKLSTAFDSSTLKFTLRATDQESSTLAAILYIDKNNDGLFSTTEAVDRHTVNRNMYDSFSYRMPNGLTGVYFWKLELKDASGAKDSFTDVVYLKGDEVKINVLQVIPNTLDKKLDLSVKLETLIAEKVHKFGYKPGEYKINVTKVTADGFNNATTGNDPLNLLNLNGNYNMIILGFQDVYENNISGWSPETRARLQNFIDTGQSVMFTHDSIYKNATIKSNFADDVGQTPQQSAADLVRYSSTSSKVTDFGLKNSATQTLYNLLLPPGEQGSVAITSVKLVNSSALSLYPFNLENTSQASMSVAKTHYQYYKLDLEDPDVVPIYNLYRSGISDRLLDDAMNNYYTYTKGTVTYSGTGHSNDSEDYKDFELKLFVNTILKAYAGANHAPTLEVAQPLNNAKLDVNSSNVALSFRGYDYDFGDNILYYKVYLDNGNGTYVLQGSETAMNNGQTVNLDIPKGFNDVRIFKLKVELRDAKNAKAEEKVLTLHNTELPLLTPVITTDKEAYLVGETINATVTLNPSGRVSPSVTITPSALKLTVPTGLGETFTNFTNLGAFSFDSTGPTTPAYAKSQTIIAALPKGTASDDYTLQAQCDYSLEGTAVSQPASKIIKVKSGTVEIWVKDDQDNPLKDIYISDNGVDTEKKTEVGGRYTFEGVTSGNHNYRIAIPNGYTLKSIQVNKKGETTGAITTTDPAIAVLAMNATDSDWQVTYVLEFGTAIEVIYMNVRPDKSLATIPKPNDTYTLRVAKKSKVSVVAFFQIPDVESTNVHTVQLTMHTELMDGTETYYTQDSDSAVLTIPGTSTPVTLNASNPRIGGAIMDKSKWATSGATPGAVYLDLFNNNSTPGFTYAGSTKWYYTVIVIEPTENQKFRVDEIKLVMDNGSNYAIPNSNAQLIHIEDLIPPKLK